MIFQSIYRFEQKLNKLSEHSNWFSNHHYDLIESNYDRQLLVYRKLNQYFIFCFQTKEKEDDMYEPTYKPTYELYCNAPATYRVVCSTDQEYFDGSGIIEKGMTFRTNRVYFDKMRNTRLSRQSEKSNSLNYDYSITIPIQAMCGYVLESIQ